MPSCMLSCFISRYTSSIVDEDLLGKGGKSMSRIHVYFVEENYRPTKVEEFPYGKLVTSYCFRASQGPQW